MKNKNQKFNSKEYYQENKERIKLRVKEYQKKKNYYENNKEKAREYYLKNKSKITDYRKEYYHKKQLDIINNYKLDLSHKNYKIYLVKIGDNRLKIGVSYIGSNRMYNLENKVKKLDFSFTPLCFFCCEDRKLLSIIEKKVKDSFCDYNWGLNEDSFKNEISYIGDLDKIHEFIKNEFISYHADFFIIDMKF